MDKIVETVEDWIQNSIFTTIDNIIIPMVEWAVKSKMRHLDETLPVSLQIQNVGNVYGLLHLLKTYPKRATHFKN